MDETKTQENETEEQKSAQKDVSEEVEIIAEKEPDPIFDNFKDYSDFYLKDRIATLNEADCLQEQKLYEQRTKNTINLPELVASLGRFIRRNDKQRGLRIKEATLVRKLTTLQSNKSKKKWNSKKLQEVGSSLVFDFKEAIKENETERKDRKNDKIILQKDYFKLPKSKGRNPLHGRDSTLRQEAFSKHYSKKLSFPRLRMTTLKLASFKLLFELMFHSNF